MASIKKYWFLSIFISIIGIFAMSHNANALTFSLDQNNYEIHYTNSRANITSIYNTNLSCSNVGWCIPDTTDGLINVQKIQIQIANHDIKKGDVVKFHLVLANRSNYSQQNVIGMTNFDTNDNYFRLLGYNVIDQSEFTNVIGDTNSTSSQYGIFKVYEIMLYARYDIPDNYLVQLESSNYNIPLFTVYASRDSSGNYKTFQFRVVNYQVLKFIGSEENREVEQKTQEAVDESQAAGGSSSSSAQTGTTGLLNAITGAVSVISSASPTNCKINGNMGNLDIGQLDLCANPAPAFITTIGSLILILMCVPLAISLFNRFIAIFRSFQS